MTPRSNWRYPREDRSPTRANSWRYWDYPYEVLVARLHGGDPGASFHLGSYFRERGSREAVHAFQKGEINGDRLPCRYFLSGIPAGKRGERQEFGGVCGSGRIYHELCEADASFMPRAVPPAADPCRQEGAEAYEGRALVRRAPLFLPLRETYFGHDPPGSAMRRSLRKIFRPSRRRSRPRRPPGKASPRTTGGGIRRIRRGFTARSSNRVSTGRRSKR